MQAAFQPLRAVIFDVDGVLCDSEPFIGEAAIRMFEVQHGIRVKIEDFLPFVGAGENRYLGGVAEKYGIPFDIEADKRFTYDTYLEIIRGRLKPLPGASDFIRHCRSLGLKLAVATSADRRKLDGNLREIGLPETLFDAAVNGMDVERRKPHPDLFLLAAKKLGIPPALCLVVEDAPNGIQAAKAAGSRCLGLTTTFPAAQLEEAGADWIAPDLAHVPAGLPMQV